MRLIGMAWLKHPTTPNPDLRAVAAEYGAEGISVYWACHELFASCYDGSETVQLSLGEICARAYVRNRRAREILAFFSKKTREIRVEIVSNPRRKTDALVSVRIVNILKLQDEYSRKQRKKTGFSPEKVAEDTDTDREKEKEKQPPSPSTPGSQRSVVVDSISGFVQENQIVRLLSEAQAAEIINKYIAAELPPKGNIRNPGGFRRYYLDKWHREGDNILNSLRIIDPSPVRGTSPAGVQYTIAVVEEAASAAAREGGANRVQSMAGPRRSRRTAPAPPDSAQMEARRAELERQAEQLRVQEKNTNKGG